MKLLERSGGSTQQAIMEVAETSIMFMVLVTNLENAPLSDEEVRVRCRECLQEACSLLEAEPSEGEFVYMARTVIRTGLMQERGGHETIRAEMARYADAVRKEGETK
jgi:hypothetical protein